MSTTESFGETKATTLQEKRSGGSTTNRKANLAALRVLHLLSGHYCTRYGKGCQIMLSKENHHDFWASEISKRYERCWRLYGNEKIWIRPQHKAEFDIQDPLLPAKLTAKQYSRTCHASRCRISKSMRGTLSIQVSDPEPMTMTSEVHYVVGNKDRL